MRENFLDDPRFDDAAVDFALVQLCKVLGVDPESFSWDAATETFTGDVQAVIGNILRAKYGEDWSSDAALSPPPATEQIRREVIALTDLLAAVKLFRGLVDEGGVPRYTITPGAALNSVIEEDIDPAIERTIRALAATEQARSHEDTGQEIKP